MNAFFATSFVGLEKCKAQTPAWQSSACGYHRCSAHKGKSPIRLTAAVRSSAFRRETQRATGRIHAELRTATLAGNARDSAPVFRIESFGVRGCVWRFLREDLFSVRGYGLRTYKSRQGRNAAT